VYALRLPVAALLLADSGHVRALRTPGGQELRCARIAAGSAVWHRLATSAAAADGAAPRRTVFRAACIVDAPLLAGRAQMLAVVPPGSLPGGGPSSAVRVLQYGPSSCVAPEGRHLLHVSMRARGALVSGAAGDPRAVLWPAIEALLHMGKEATQVGEQAQLPARPRLLWAMFYALEEAEEAEGAPNWLPENGALAAGAGSEVDVCASVRAAETAFARLFPGLPFFACPSESAAKADDDDGLDMALLTQPTAA
jgi:hypothetical protein